MAGELLFPGKRLEGELLFTRRKVGRGISVSRDEVWKESFCLHGERLEGEFLFPGMKFARRASVSRKEV